MSLALVDVVKMPRKQARLTREAPSLSLRAAQDGMQHHLLTIEDILTGLAALGVSSRHRYALLFSLKYVPFVR